MDTGANTPGEHIEAIKESGRNLGEKFAGYENFSASVSALAQSLIERGTNTATRAQAQEAAGLGDSELRQVADAEADAQQQAAYALLELLESHGYERGFHLEEDEDARD